jgi:hypothetical protein
LGEGRGVEAMPARRLLEAGRELVGAIRGADQRA